MEDDVQEVEETQDAVQEEVVKATISRIVRVPLTDEEMLNVAAELTEAMEAIEKLETDKASIAKGYKDKITAKSTAAHELAGKFREGARNEEMDCPIEFDWDNNTKRVLHPTTNEVLFEDVISEKDRQSYMPGFEAPKDVPFDDQEPEETEESEPTTEEAE